MRCAAGLAALCAAVGARAAEPPPPPSFAPPSLHAPSLQLAPSPAAMTPLPSLLPPPAPAPPDRQRAKKIEQVYDVHIDLDASLLVLGAALWGSTSVIRGGDTPGSWCGGSGQAPCDRSGINALDRLALDRYDPNAALTANVFTGIVPGALIVMSVADVGITHWRAWLADAVVIGESVVWTGAAQDIVRRAVRRPRPYMYTPGLDPGNRDGPESMFSFFSGHTSNTFAMATATAYTYSLRHPGSRWQWLVWTLAMAGATVEPVTRVLSGEHFPTDALIGALVGSGAGVLFPALHRRRSPLQLTASSTAERTTIGLAGRF